MKSIKIICILAFVAFGVGALFTDNRFLPVAESYSDGPPPGMTGAPGDVGDCRFCHDPNKGPGVFAIIAPGNYDPGQTYEVRVQHSTTDSTRLRWGFELTSLDGTHSAAGTFANTTAFTRDDFGDGRFYVTHNQAGSFAGIPDGVTWSFNWTAPATNVGPVTFYAAGNQADNNSSTSGDQIYLTTTIVNPAGSPTPTETPTATATETPAGTPSISGVVTYGNSNAGTKFISNATVTGAGVPVFTTTDAPGATAGQYTLTGFGNGDYTVSLSKTTGQNAITSNDAARIAQHVAGVSLLANNNQRVTADVSGNNAVSSNDAAKIAQFVAGVSPLPLPNLTNTWQFYLPPGPTFPVGSSPTSRTYSPVTGNLTGEDYVGLLIGEVTGNWTPGPLRPAQAPVRGLSIELPNVSASGKEIVVPITIDGATDMGIISYEFDVKFDPKVIEPLADPVDLSGSVSRGLFAVANTAEVGRLRIVVYGPTPIDTNGVLLNLRFKGVGDAGSVSPLTWERIMFNEGEPLVTTIDGQVELLFDAADKD